MPRPMSGHSSDLSLEEQGEGLMAGGELQAGVKRTIKCVELWPCG